jgi:tetratricopeptide (TPR) repeat protein
LHKTIIKYLILLFLAILLWPQFSAAQHHDSQLAAEYLRRNEFDKAAILYQQLYEEHGYKTYRTNYIKCLNELKEYDTAEKFLKKEIKREKEDASLRVDLGNLYLLQNDIESANNEFNTAIEISSTNKPQTVNTANSFIMHRLFTFAERMYEEAAIKQKTSYDYELANIYYYQRDFQRMIDKFLDLIIDQPNYLENVQNRLQSVSTAAGESELNEMLENSLILRIQKNPQSAALNEMLIWQYSQTGRFREALDQNIALDKRSNEKGFKVLQYGRILKENEAYDLALEAFQYVMDEGDDLPNYQVASIEYLNTLYGKVISDPKRTEAELLELESLLKTSLTKIRKNQSFTLIYALASIQAFYLNKTDEAATFLKEIVDENKLNPFETAQCKLLYGDVLLLNNNPWESTIVYAQVEQTNKNNPFGHEARFRKAKLAYYTGQFEWAQAQLDVLKASTSKLIANDAFELSMFISENTALDTTEFAMQMFARADLLIYKHQENLALLTLDSIQELFPNHMLADDIYYRKGQIYEQQGELDSAIEMYNVVLKQYSFDLLADNALHQLSRLYDFGLQDTEHAMQLYEQMMLDYPGSIFTVEARKRYRFLRGDRLEDPNE